ncbi:uracil-DNA glycosylase [Cryobacterium sp. TMT1-3]|uniref:uracil-DNA glycosylase n=1 Tax=Cryobacterium sp. TMT1-3 TaxID=1259237 RepID=UPI00106AC5C5|nr:uracil-DNA glycosylase [Cryobacterium sp. TMT1-3]TFC28776.1 uracil-DNA glycosylase [Cryobacterium sp. TMT1-3]
MSRRMRDENYRADQWQHRYDPHIKPINDYIDEIRTAELWVPYVAPAHGGINARVLSVLRDPGPATRKDVGSGFISVENDDPTAERQCNRFESVGLSAYDILPWNAYPWYINRAPKATELEAGVDTILEMLRLAPAVQVVLLQGGDARRSWRRVLRRSPNLTENRELTVIPTYHPGIQALWHRDPAERIRRVNHQTDAYRQLAAILA